VIVDGHQHLDDVEAQLAGMDEAGLDRIVLFARVNHPRNLAEYQAEMADRGRALASGYEPAGEEHVAAAAELQRDAASAPDRLAAFGWVPLGLDDDATADWVAREVVARGFIGLGELRFGQGHARLLEPVFRAAEAFGNLPLWVHGFTPLTWPDLAETLELATLHPDVPLIVGHLGGFHWADVVVRLREIPNGYLDLTAPIMTFQLRYAIAELPDRVVFGSDVPYGDPVVVRHWIERSCPDESAVDRVLGANLAALLELN
jgi:predicted TIM-barrel fold metal-dependent hydrolase